MAENIILRNKFFVADKLLDGVTRITGLAGELCYLIEGTERTLLIDGLSGVGSLRAFVRELTELPVTRVATHGHIDHIGAAWEYGEVFIHPDDIALMYTEMHSSVESRLKFTGSNPAMEKRTKTREEDVPPAHGIKTYPVYDGDVFQLGGMKIEVIGVPGHTYGTLVFLDRAKRVVYSGDACNINTLLHLVGSTTVEEYLQSLQHFKTFQKDFDVTYGGHIRSAVPNTIIDDGIAMCRRILNETDEAVPLGSYAQGAFLASDRGADYVPKCGGYCNIVYRKDMKQKRVHPEILGAPNYYR